MGQPSDSEMLLHREARLDRLSERVAWVAFVCYPASSRWLTPPNAATIGDSAWKIETHRR